MAEALPAVAETEVGESGTKPLTIYANSVGLVSPPSFVGVRVIDPATVGLIVNVCGVAELENVNTVAESPDAPVTVEVIVMVPVYE